MSKRRKILLMLAKEGASQSEVAAALHASKRDVSACARAMRERGLTSGAASAMTEAEVDAMPAPPREPAESACLAPDVPEPVEHRGRSRKPAAEDALDGAPRRRAGGREGGVLLPDLLRDVLLSREEGRGDEGARARARPEGPRRLGGRHRARHRGRDESVRARRRAPLLGAGAMGERLRETAGGGPCNRHAFGGRAGMPVGAEASARRDRKVAKLVRESRLELPGACVEDVVRAKGREPGRDRVAGLASREWVEAREVVVTVSRTGCGKSFLGQALGNAAACRRPPRGHGGTRGDARRLPARAERVAPEDGGAS